MEGTVLLVGARGTRQMGFQQSVHEAAVYRRGSGRTVLLVGVYVDDLIITGVDP
jgi:hypothetical protein